MIEQNQAYKLEFQNFRRVHRNRAVGELFAIELEITEDDWHHLSDFPQDALGEVALCWTERAEAPPKHEKKAKGPYGAFWNAMVKSTAFDCRDFQTWLRVESREEAIPALREAFSVDSLSFVPPQNFITLIAAANLTGVAAIARRLANQ